MEKKIKIQVRDLNLYYGQNHALHGVNMDIKENSVTALIGPSGCGKSTFLKCINRMNDLVDNVRIEGSIEIDGENIYAHRERIWLLENHADLFAKYGCID